MASPRPNILWILTTQWRGQALGYAGDPNARTPALDALAAKSLDFRQAVTPHPFGPFARAALLTGIPSPENGVVGYFDPLPRDSPTIAHDLAGQGYATGFLGKWHLSRRAADDPLVGEAHARLVVPPESRGGFEFWQGFESGFLLNDPWIHGTGLDQPVRFSGYQADILCRLAGEWIGSRAGGKPWFCLLSMEPPHPPYAAPAAGVAPLDPGGIRLRRNVPSGDGTERTARRELSGYYAHLEATDRALGRLLASPALAEAIVVFTSVHGDMHGSHGLFRKGWPHEESIRVPLLLRLPMGGTAGGRDDAVSLIDLHHWTRAWARGDSLLSPLASRRSPYASISMPSVVPVPHQCDRPWRGVRGEGRKLILGPAAKPWLYFNLEEDPWEMENLAEEPRCRPEIASLARRAGLASE